MTTIETTKPGPTGPQEAPARIGTNELGRIKIEARAVEKVAAIAAAEIAEASGGGGRGHGTSYLGLRRSSMERLPKVNAEVDGDIVFLEVELSIRWPASAIQVTEGVRRNLFRRLNELMSLRVSAVNIEVVDFITETAPPRVS